MEDDGTIMRLYLVGNPVRHSLSPVIYNKFFEKRGINAVYRALEVTDGFSEVLQFLRQGSVGFNITIPYKHEAYKLVDELDTPASIIGAVNTVKSTPRGLKGYNTDWVGFKKAIEEAGGRRYYSALVIGAGGAGRAAAYALKDVVEELYIVSRTGVTAEKLASLALDWGVARAVGGKASFSNLSRITPNIDLIVNASPVGLADPSSSPLPQTLIPEDCTVVDMVYSPLETRLIKDAREKGCVTVDGLWMLAHQATVNLKVWFGLEADPLQLRSYALSNLGGEM